MKDAEDTSPLVESLDALGLCSLPGPGRREAGDAFDTLGGCAILGTIHGGCALIGTIARFLLRATGDAFDTLGGCALLGAIVGRDNDFLERDGRCV